MSILVALEDNNLHRKGEMIRFYIISEHTKVNLYRIKYKSFIKEYLYVFILFLIGNYINMCIFYQRNSRRTKYCNVTYCYWMHKQQTVPTVYRDR